MYVLRKWRGSQQPSQNSNPSKITGGVRTEPVLTSAEQETSVKFYGVRLAPLLQHLLAIPSYNTVDPKLKRINLNDL